MQKFNKIIREVSLGCANIWVGITQAWQWKRERGQSCFGQGKFLILHKSSSFGEFIFTISAFKISVTIFQLTRVRDSHYRRELPSHWP